MTMRDPDPDDIVKVVKDTFSTAFAFFPVEGPGDTSWGKVIIGWTFRVSGSFMNRRYGWATTEGFVFTDLCNSRSRAEEIMRKVVRDEEERAARK